MIFINTLEFGNFNNRVIINMSKLELSIVIINYNSAHLLKECLASLEDASLKISYEVIVIDNASSDDSYEFIKSNQRIQWIQNPQNYGFAKACNKAFRYTLGDKVVFLNVDTKVIEGSLESLCRYLDEHSDVGACGPAFVDQRGKKKNGMDNFPSMWTVLCNKTLLRWIFPKQFPHKRVAYQQPKDVDSLVGACFFKKEVIPQERCVLSNDGFACATL